MQKIDLSICPLKQTSKINKSEPRITTRNNMKT